MKCMKRMNFKKERITKDACKTVSVSSSSPVEAQILLSSSATHLPLKNSSHLRSSIHQNLPEAPTDRAQLHGRVADRKRSSSHGMIWVRNDIFRPEVYDFKSYLQ